MNAKPLAPSRVEITSGFLILSFSLSTTTQQSDMSLRLLLSSIYLLLISNILAQDAQQPIQGARKRPNIVFILTDDQDLHMDSLSYMPFLKEHLIDRGLSFNRHFCTVALCCPSRVSMWTGKAARRSSIPMRVLELICDWHIRQHKCHRYQSSIR